mmetsp:Transcript_7176/g.31625  ORF Transcript_7176/g.31625 Transcript_7176/m.31625 type:complete len:288 (-) Transcript_7176:829-1692(-)
MHRGERWGQGLGGGGLGHLRSRPGFGQRGEERPPQFLERRDERSLEILDAHGERVGHGGELKRGLDALLAGDSPAGTLAPDPRAAGCVAAGQPLGLSQPLHRGGQRVDVPHKPVVHRLEHRRRLGPRGESHAPLHRAAQRLDCDGHGRRHLPRRRLHVVATSHLQLREVLRQRPRLELAVPIADGVEGRERGAQRVGGAFWAGRLRHRLGRSRKSVTRRAVRRDEPIETLRHHALGELLPRRLADFNPRGGDQLLALARERALAEGNLAPQPGRDLFAVSREPLREP